MTNITETNFANDLTETEITERLIGNLRHIVRSDTVVRGGWDVLELTLCRLAQCEPQHRPAVRELPHVRFDWYDSFLRSHAQQWNDRVMQINAYLVEGELSRMGR